MTFPYLVKNDYRFLTGGRHTEDLSSVLVSFELYDKISCTNYDRYAEEEEERDEEVKGRKEWQRREEKLDQTAGWRAHSRTDMRLSVCQSSILCFSRATCEVSIRPFFDISLLSYPSFVTLDFGRFKGIKMVLSKGMKNCSFDRYPPVIMFEEVTYIFQ